MRRVFKAVENYIYFYHTKTFLLIPTWPESFSDTNSASFSSETPLARSAPVFSYSHSGPRTVQISLKLHREMLHSVDYSKSLIAKNIPNFDDDYIDVLFNQIEGAVLPEYSLSEKMVDPPIVAVRFGNDLYIKGVISGSITKDFSLPILKNNKYAQVGINFQVQEFEPYSASQAMLQGGYRGLDTTLERKLWEIK